MRVARASVVLWIERAFRALGRRLLFAGKALAVVASLAGVAWGGQQAIRHVMASPRFAVRDVRVGATTHVDEQDVLALAAVRSGDRLLAVDTDAVAARVAAHPWVASARVRRLLPSALMIDVVERKAVASALLGTLYLVDVTGHPFKRATLAEADGLPVITGVAREQYTAYPAATESAFREALALVAAYAGHHRPALSEVHVDPRYGFSLVLFEGGGEIRLGRGNWSEKLARFDDILAALAARAAGLPRVVYLDGSSADRVSVRLGSDRDHSDDQKISAGDKTR